MLKRIVIVSSGQPSANPRAVKEAVLLSQNNFIVTFIYCPLSPWADAYDDKLFSQNPTIKWICVGSHPNNNSTCYKIARIRRRYWQIIHSYFANKFNSDIKSSVLFSQELLKETLKHKADLFIGHNLGAIQAVIKASVKFNAKVGFDAEDFHRGEFEHHTKARSLIESIEEKYFPQLDYCTAASPLIAQAYKFIFQSKNFTTINNVFSKKYLNNTSDVLNTSSLNLFWFSQFIGPKRGLEVVVEALNECKGLDINLHLLGNINTSYKQFILETLVNNNQVTFLSPVAPEEIFEIASKFDIGLATEVPNTQNRDYCLTNKIFTYLLAGNVMVLSDTKAQHKFLKDYPSIGILFESENKSNLAKVFKELYEDRDMLQRMKSNALRLASDKMNWEEEGVFFIDLINETLSNN